MNKVVSLTFLEGTEHQVIGFSDCRFCSEAILRNIKNMSGTHTLSKTELMNISSQIFQFFHQLLEKLLIVEQLANTRTFFGFKCKDFGRCQLKAQIFLTKEVSAESYMKLAKHLFSLLLIPFQQRILSFNDFLDEPIQYESYLCRVLLARSLSTSN